MTSNHFTRPSLSSNPLTLLGTSWPELQHEVTHWASYNFGSMQEAWQPILGVVEEVAEFYSNTDEKIIAWGQHAGLSAGLIVLVHPGKTLQDSKLELEDAIGDQAIYLLNLATKCGIDFGSDIMASGNQAQKFSEREVIGFLGLGCQAILKHSQGIRGVTFEERRHRMTMVLNLWHRWCLCKIRDFELESFEKIVVRTWRKVQQRDWKKNPESANKVEQKDEYDDAFMADWRESNACKVCGSVPDKEGLRQHGKGCYTINENGGGTDHVTEPAE